jgi:hypothetical protein
MSHHAMTPHDKGLKLLTFGGTGQKAGKLPFSRTKKPANAFALLAFFLVAGIGFEPMTFRFAT